MAIFNAYTGFQPATAAEYAASNLDSDFGANLNRSIPTLNQTYATAAGIRNSYVESFTNSFGSSSKFSTNEQRLIQSMISESINVNGITVRYMPRVSKFTDHVWNESPEARFAKGTEMDMILVAAAGFEGEGDVMTQYGIEFREEVFLTVSIPRFEELYTNYEGLVAPTELPNVARDRPLEGDLVVIPFGRSANNKNQYVPKVFEIVRVTTYHDGAFFQLGDNYQYKIHAKLFELSGEDMEFNPTIVQYDKSGAQTTYIDSETGYISKARTGLIDPDTQVVNIVNDSEALFDSWASNTEIEIRSQEMEIWDSEGAILEAVPLVVDDLSAKGHKQFGTIDNLDNI